MNRRSFFAKVASALAKTSPSMTMRTNSHGDKISLLGYGMMRLPTLDGRAPGEFLKDDPKKRNVDQEMLNRQIDYAIENGVNYFDVAPVYCKGYCEKATAIALSRHPREKWRLATKASNFAKSLWPIEKSKQMYYDSMKTFNVDYIDYYLLHACGIGGGFSDFESRFLKNGFLDFLVKEREAGRIKNLGWSFHGDFKCFRWFLEHHKDYKWDFAQIQLNYLDWRHAKLSSKRNFNAELLYDELTKRNIPVVVMEPLLGGRLAKYNEKSAQRLAGLDDEATPAKWAMRFAGTHKNVLTVLSGMTLLEHLEENVATFSPLKPLNEEEFAALERAAQAMISDNAIQCNMCNYCMPCPYGLDIPSTFDFWNRADVEGWLPTDPTDPKFRENARRFLIEYDRTLPKLRQSARCTTCGRCSVHCPQGLDIPSYMCKVDAFVEKVRRIVNA